MRWLGIGTKTREVPAGILGTARVGRSPEAVMRRLGRGDIAVLDQVDLDRATATALVDAGVAGVVNVSPSISGRYPTLGPEILTGAGVALIDDVGDAVLHEVKDGGAIRLHEGTVHVGDREIAHGFVQTPDTVAELLAEARAGLSCQLDAFSANTTEFMGREQDMLLDGVGVPALSTAVAGRQVVVVAAGPEHAAELHRLRHFIREYHPVLVGVGAGAHALRDAGHQPAVVVGTATELDPEVARRAADVVVPADPDGHVAGQARLQDMGIEPVAFASSANPEDMALILAHSHGASLVVAVGFDATLGGFLDRGRSGSNPSTFLTRLRLGPSLVDASAVLGLYQRRLPAWVIALLVTVLLVALVAVALVSGLGQPLLAHLDQFTTTARGIVGPLLHGVHGP